MSRLLTKTPCPPLVVCIRVLWPGKGEALYSSQTVMLEKQASSRADLNGAAGDGREADRALLEFYAPAAIVVTRQWRVLERRGNLRPFGLPDRFTRVPQNSLGEAIRRGVETAALADRRHVEELPGQARLSIMPLAASGPRKRLFLVIFQAPEQVAADRIRELESQLAAANTYLADALTDYEAATEELQSAHEELKCANEELHQLNHDLGSANEDLGHLNAALEARSRDLQHVNTELVNLLGSVGIPMVMLGKDLRIRRFNSQAERFFNLQKADIGKRIRDVRPSIGLPYLEEACLDVLDTFSPRSRHVHDAAGRDFSLLLRPYRTQDNQVDGVVLALVENGAPYRSVPSSPS